ncbi:MAG TPA: dNTP triphosphohydrolase [Bryobacteraceae bacterium]|nr:dNTP triphosphohydrolase [Bryobacteraceae bacterium]
MNGPALSDLRFGVEHSQGRRYPELSHPYRNEFQRDRDRVVHARAFRRLEDKTQVFTPGLHDHFRNRLTHTIEVVQIARTLTHALGLNQDLAEALALAHDIGHPPFAHSGEEELDRQMQRFGERFDHNLHSLRIVEHFEQRYARFPGLNLTFEVREGIVKHSRDFEAGEFPELDEYRPGERPPLEAQLIDLADEIAYNTADLDDGFSAGMFTIDQVVEEVPHYRELWESVDTQFAAADERLRFNEALRMLIDWLVSGLLDGTMTAVREAGTVTIDDVRRHGERLVRFAEGAGETNSALKQFLRKQVYYTPPLVEERKQSSRRIAELFQYFLDNPAAFGQRDEAAPAHRVICDYIAGMTDGFFRRTYAELLGT